MSVLFYRLDVGSQPTLDYGGFVAESGRWLAVALLFALPFVFSGLMLGPVLAVALSVTWGMDILLLSPLPVYMAARWLLPAAARAARPQVAT